ncbi:hypothetical protein ACLB2K_024598 [Fragaria x ananassa]
MVEGGAHPSSKTEFTECWKTTWRTPYIMRLALSAGIGGLLFGYDTVAGAIIGAAIGGWMNDALGRKKSILIADVVFFVGAIVMAAAPVPWVIIIGRIIVGLGVGMASMTAPLYISEASPHRIRGALVSTNGLLITGGQFLSYLINLAFTKTPGTWRWMVGVAGLPAVVQFILMLSLPESPRWLYRDNKVDEARAILAKIYPAEEVDDELKALQESVEFEKSEEGAIGKTMLQKVKSCFGNTVVRRGLYAGITVQVAQQFVGINTVMYYSPSIVQFAGFASNQTAMALSLVTSGLNVVGTLISMCFVDRYGRRRLMIISMFGIISCLIVLAGVFYYAASHSPTVSHLESNHFGTNTTCPAYVSAPNPAAWDCMTCLKYTDCAFCSIRGQNVSSNTSPSAFQTTNKKHLLRCNALPTLKSLPKIVNKFALFCSSDFDFDCSQLAPGACLAASDQIRVNVVENTGYGTLKVVLAKLVS